MSVEANKAVVRRLVEEVFNQGRLDAVHELFGPGHVHHVGAREFRGPDGARVVVAGIHAQFPEYRMTIDDLVAERDRVVASFSVRAAHGMTGRAVAYSGIDIYRLADGKIIERRGLIDTAAIEAQLRGDDPAPAG
jgi:predicted ester cyclase